MAFESAIWFMKEIHGRIELIEEDIRKAKNRDERLTRLRDAFIGFTPFYHNDDDSEDSDDENFKDIEDRRYVPHTSVVMEKFATWVLGMVVEEGLDDLKKAFCKDMALLKLIPDFETIIFRDELAKMYKGDIPKRDLTSDDVRILQAEVHYILLLCFGGRYDLGDEQVWDKKSKLFGDKQRMVMAINELSHVKSAHKDIAELEVEMAECMAKWRIII